MNSFVTAIRFLTIIPGKGKVSEKALGRSQAYFPVAGLAIGGVLALVFAGLRYAGLPLLSIDMLVVGVLMLITGGLHLDGVADSADALASGQDREGMLKVMRDPRTGSQGMVGVLVVILGKIALLFAIPAKLQPAALLLMCSLSRWSAVFLMQRFPYLRAAGKVSVFKPGAQGRSLKIATIIALAVALLFGRVRCIALVVAVLLVAFYGGKFAVKRFGGITGDLIGLLVECSELAVLLVFALSVVK